MSNMFRIPLMLASVYVSGDYGPARDGSIRPRDPSNTNNGGGGGGSILVLVKAEINVCVVPIYHLLSSPLPLLLPPLRQ